MILVSFNIKFSSDYNLFTTPSTFIYWLIHTSITRERIRQFKLLISLIRDRESNHLYLIKTLEFLIEVEEYRSSRNKRYEGYGNN